MVFDPLTYLNEARKNGEISPKLPGMKNGSASSDSGMGSNEETGTLNPPTSEDEDDELLDVETSVVTPKIEPEINTNPVELRAQLSCVKTYVIEPLFRNNKSVAFRKPVDPIALGIPDYPKIITRPMDLGTIRDKIKNKRYSSLQECLHNIDLIWKNAKKFNPPDHFVHKFAVELEELSKDKISKIDFTRCEYKGTLSGSSHKTPRRTSLALANKSKKRPVVSPVKKSVTPVKNPSSAFQKPQLPSGTFSTKDPLDACKEIIEELVSSDVHKPYSSKFYSLPAQAMDLSRLFRNVSKNIYAHPFQVAEDFRSMVSSIYKKYGDLSDSSTTEMIGHLHHKFEVLFARRVVIDIPPKLELSDENIFTQQLLLAQNSMLSIQNELQILVQKFYKRKSKIKKRSPSINKKKRRSISPAPFQPPQKKLKEELPKASQDPKWTRDQIIDLQNRIGQLDENHQQPILALMHKNGEKITEDEEGYVVLDIEEASSKSLEDIKKYIDGLKEKKPSPKKSVTPAKAPTPKQSPRTRRLSESSDSDDSSDSDSSDSSSNSSDDEGD